MNLKQLVRVTFLIMVFMLVGEQTVSPLYAQAGKTKIIQVGSLKLSDIFELIQKDRLLRHVLDQGASEDLLAAREIDQKISDLEAKLERDQDLLSKQKQNDLQNEITYYRTELAYLLGGSASINLENNDSRYSFSTSILREVYRVVRKVAQREGYSLILEQGASVIYWEEYLDITPLVKAELIQLKTATN